MTSKYEPRQLVTRDGLAYLATGSNTSRRGLLFCHGWACQGSDFTHLLQNLAQSHPEYYYVAPYLPGHGPSATTLLPTPSIPALAQIILAMIQELEWKEIILVGHSMGSRVVLETWAQAAQSSPGLVKGIVLLEGSHARPRSKSRFERADHEGAAGTVDIFQEMFSPATPVAFAEDTEAHARSRDMGYSAQLRKAYMDWDERDMDAVIARVGESGTPVLQIQSTDVDATNRRNRLRKGDYPVYMRYVKENVPTVEQVVVEDAGHFPHIDQHGLVAQSIDDFLETVYKA